MIPLTERDLRAIMLIGAALFLLSVIRKIDRSGLYWDKPPR